MKEWTKKLVALLCSVMLLCSLTSVGVTADNGLEIWDGLDTVYLPFAAEFYPYCSVLPDGVYEEDLVWTVGDESLVQYIEEVEYSYVYCKAIAAGETTLTASTADGVYSDTVTLVIQSAIPMVADSVTVYVNSVYQARTFEYVPQKTGAYTVGMDLPANSYGYVTVYDAQLNTVSSAYPDEMVELTAGETYYLFVIGVPYAGVSMAFDLSLTYIGGSAEYQEPNSIVFAEDEITMSVYDTVAFPAYTFEPGGDEWYDSVTFSVEDGSVLTVDNNMGFMYASGVGTVTLTATADTNGWTDTVTVNIVDEKRVLTTDATLAMSVNGLDELAVFFTAPETKTYVFYSVAETERDDPRCWIYDAETDELITYSDDVDNLDFAASVELTEGQTVKLVLGGYNSENNFELGVGDPVAATGVEVVLYDAVSRQGNTVYVLSGTWLYPDASFLGGSTVITEEYDIVISSEDATPDEYGEYMLEAGQSATVTVTTASGLTDTVTVVAIDMLNGDINLDGKVNLTDASALFYAVNGLAEPDAATLGAMEVSGDNAVTVLDATQLFYYVNGLIETL